MAVHRPNRREEQVIQSQVAPTTWEGSGPGSISFFAGNLVVPQTQRVHEQIAELLNEFRKVRDQRRKTAPPHIEPKQAEEPEDPDALAVRVYSVSGFGGGGGFRVSKLAGIEPPPKQSNQSPKDILPQFGGLAPGDGTHLENALPSGLEALRELAKIIPAVIAPQTWDTNGGPGMIRVVPAISSYAAGSLIVRQTPAVHRQIEALLRELP